MKPDAAQYFPGYSEDRVWEKVREHWDFENYSFPIPKFDIHCTQCGSDDIQIKRYDLHKSDSRTIPCRVDVVVRCCTCSMVLPAFGVPIPPHLYNDLRSNHRNLRWIGALALMVERGEIDRDDLCESVCERATEWLNNYDH